MHCLLHLNESLNLEDFLSLSHQQNASVGPFWSIIDRNDRFPTLSYASNNEIQAIFLKPVKGTHFVHSSPRCSAQRNNLVQQETRVLNTPISIKVASEKNDARSMFHSPRCIIVASLVSFVPATSLET